MSAVFDQLRGFLYAMALLVAVGTVWVTGYATELDTRLKLDQRVKVDAPPSVPAAVDGPSSLADVAAND